MLVHFTPSSDVVVGMLIFYPVLVLAFEDMNGFDDTSSAIATVVYTNARKPVPAVLWSGLLNFVGALVGVAAAGALMRARGLGQGVDWHQIIKVLEALAVFPILGLIGAGGLSCAATCIRAG